MSAEPEPKATQENRVIYQDKHGYFVRSPTRAERLAQAKWMRWKARQLPNGRKLYEGAIAVLMDARPMTTTWIPFTKP